MSLQWASNFTDVFTSSCQVRESLSSSSFSATAWQSIWYLRSSFSFYRTLTGSVPLFFSYFTSATNSGRSAPQATIMCFGRWICLWSKLIAKIRRGLFDRIFISLYAINSKGPFARFTWGFKYVIHWVFAVTNMACWFQSRMNTFSATLEITCPDLVLCSLVSIYAAVLSFAPPKM